MARQHGYFLLIPAFVPVDKNNLKNQIEAGQVIHEAAEKRDLSAIMALEGIRYHAQFGRDGAVKDLHVRWGSKGIGDAVPESEADTEFKSDEEVTESLDSVFSEESVSEAREGAESKDDAAVSQPRRSRAKAA